jgi:hypothetical protein
MLSGLLFIELIAHYYADIYDADKRGLSIWVKEDSLSPKYVLKHPMNWKWPLSTTKKCLFLVSTPFVPRKITSKYKHFYNLGPKILNMVKEWYNGMMFTIVLIFFLRVWIGGINW